MQAQYSHRPTIAGLGLLFLLFGSYPVRSQTVDIKGGVTPVPEVVVQKRGAADCENGFAGPYPCENVHLVSFLSRVDVGAGDYRVNDLWGWEDPATGRRYVLLGREDATAFVDITDPEQPVYVGHLPRTQRARASVWRDVKVYDNHAFIVADGAGEHGMQVFDLTLLRGLDGSSPVTFSEKARYEGFGSAHNIVINEETGFAYAVGSSRGQCDAGLHMIDIRHPARPQFAGCHRDLRTRRGYTHDAQCVVYAGPDVAHQGKEVCFSSNEDSISIADVTDKTLVRPLGVASYPNSGYVHQGWLTEDQRYFFQNDELDERGFNTPTRTLIWDVTDLDDPQLAAEFEPGTNSIDHNLYVEGNRVFQANYTAGLQVLDITDPEDPFRVGFFDTTPSDDGVTFNGTWSVYPWFSDGTIALSSRSEGLYLLRLSDVLASRLGTFEAVSEGQDVTVSWTMQQQLAIDRFDLEVSRSGDSYRVVGSVPGGGSSTTPRAYNLTASQLEPGKNSVRLVAVSAVGGRTVLIEDEVFVVPGTHVLVAPYPNPAAGLARSSLIVGRTQSLTVGVYDAAGRLVASVFDGVAEAEQELVFEIDTTSLPAGRYWVRYQGSRFSQTEALVVAR